MSLEANKELFRKHIDIHWHKFKRFDQDDPVLAQNYTGHNVLYEANGLNEYNGYNAALHAAFPDVHITIENQVAEGDRVANLIVLEGTHKGDLMGIAPTGKRVKIGVLVLIRVSEGRIAESWGYADWLGMFQQIGAIPPLG